MNILLNEKLVDSLEVLIEKVRKGLITFAEYVRLLRKRFLKHQHNVLQARIIKHRKDTEESYVRLTEEIKTLQAKVDTKYMEKVDYRCGMIARKRKLWYKY